MKSSEIENLNLRPDHIHMSCFCERCGKLYATTAADPLNVCGECRQADRARVEEVKA